MKKHLSFKCLIILLIYITACASSNKSHDQWEGISGNSLVVIISEFFPFEENLSSEEINKQIRERLDQRASLIIASYISLNLSRDKISHNNDVLLNNQINQTLAGVKVVKSDCYENNYCNATGEYDIKELQKNLDIINNN